MNHPPGRRRHDCWQNDFREYAVYMQKTLFMLQKAYSCMTRVPHSSAFHGSRRVQTAFHSDPIPEERKREKCPLLKDAAKERPSFLFPFSSPSRRIASPIYTTGLASIFGQQKTGRGGSGAADVPFVPGAGFGKVNMSRWKIE